MSQAAAFLLVGEPAESQPDPAAEAQPDPLAERRHRLFVGLWQLVLAVGTTVALLLCWPLASGKGVTAPVLLVGLFGGVAGSLVHTITIFSSRVGRSTFEATYLWWYVLRPFAAALLAVLFVASIQSGAVAMTNASDAATPVVAVVAGGLAGLFTDTVLQVLRTLLGATNTEHKASEQKVPLTGS